MRVLRSTKNRQLAIWLLGECTCSPSTCLDTQHQVFTILKKSTIMVTGCMKSIQLGFVQHSPGTETQQNLTECCHRPSHPLCWKMAAKNVPVSLSVTSDFLFLSHRTGVKIRQLSYHCFCSTNWDESILSFRDFECLICAFITATLDCRNALYVFISRASISRLQLP